MSGAVIGEDVLPFDGLPGRRREAASEDDQQGKHRPS